MYLLETIRTTLTKYTAHRVFFCVIKNIAVITAINYLIVSLVSNAKTQ